MKLITCNIDKNIILNENLIELFGDDIEIKMFYSEEYEREYDVYCISNGIKKAILKKVTNPKEIHINNFLNDKNFNFIPKIIGFLKIDNNTWMITSFVEEKSYIYSESILLELIDDLSNLNGSLLGSKINNAEKKIIKFWSKIDNKLLNDFSSELNKNEIQTIIDSQNILDSCKRTLIHGDMIPLNILISEDGIKIIDWEHLSFSPYVLDISRLLGDYNKTVKWIESKYEKKMLDRYFDNLKAKLKISYKEFILQYHCGVLENYLKILLSHKKNKLRQTSWYELNFLALKGEIEFLQNFENKSI